MKTRATAVRWARTLACALGLATASAGCGDAGTDERAPEQPAVVQQPANDGNGNGNGNGNAGHQSADGAGVCITFARGTTGGAIDTYVRAPQPNTSFAAADPLRPASNAQALVQFDISALPPNAAITSATLKMRATQGGGSISVHKISKSWVETVTYAQFYGAPLPAFSPAVEATFAVQPHGFKSADVKAAVTGWYASPSTNHGFLLEASTSAGLSSSEAAAAGDRPSLRVCYIIDADGDGSPAAADCNDNDPTVHPGATELCDGIDNDCTGGPDNGNPGGGLPCDSGGCGPGTTTCVNGAVTCVANQPYQGCTAPPVVTILSPAPDAVASANSIEVTGTISAPATVTVGGVAASQSGLSFSALVPLHEGSNIVVASATDALGSTGVASVVVLRDTTPPRINILSPGDQSLIPNTTVTVVGTVQDLLIGTVDAGDCTVTVNGIQAEVASRGFRALGVPVAKGTGTITAIATDRGGNMASSIITVTGDPDPKARIVVSSGDGQSAPVTSVLPLPLRALVMNNVGSPVAGVPVTFSIARGNGSLGGAARTQTVMSNAAGLAEVSLKLGSQSGQATDLVQASAPGFLGVATFAESAQSSPVGQRMLQAIGGVSQRVAVASAAGAPLTALLLDSFGNPVEGQDVTFTVMKGGGRVNGAASATITTDSDGRAYVVLTAGGAAGINTELVRASYPGASPVHFVASAVVQGPAASTEVSGVVETNENAPIANVAVRITGSGIQDVLTSADGRFSIVGAPVGRIHLEIDGTTAGPYPPLSFELDLLSGVNNIMDRPVYLPTIDASGVGIANTVSDLEIRRADTPGLVFGVRAGSATFNAPPKQCSVDDDPYPCGLGCPCVNGVCSPKCGAVQVITVHRDKIPMVPPDGAFPSMALAIMPHDATFDPPAPIRFPNVEGRAPGEIITIHSYDHDLGAFVGIGTAQVSEDGLEVVSGPGQGIVKGGWHLVLPEPSPNYDMFTGELLACDCSGCCTAYYNNESVVPFDPTVQCVSPGLPSCPATGPDPFFQSFPPQVYGIFVTSPDIGCYSCPDPMTGVAVPLPASPLVACDRYDTTTMECPASGPAHCMYPTGSSVPVCCPDAQNCTNGAGCPISPGNAVCCATACQPSGMATDCCL